LIKPITEKYKKVIIVGGGNSLRDFDFSLLNNLPNDTAIIQVNGYRPPKINFLDLYQPTHFVGIDLTGFIIPLLQMKDIKTKRFYCVPFDYGREDAKRPKDKNKKMFKTCHYLARARVNTNAEITKEKAMLCEDKSFCQSYNSGYAAFNLAYHFEAEKVLLLGIDADLKPHFFEKEDHELHERYKFSMGRLPHLFEIGKEQMDRKGVKIINGSLTSNINCFKKTSRETGLEWVLK
jgi:hypothetical protein